MTYSTTQGITLRPYEPADAIATLAVFTEAITQTAAAYYTAGQIEAWAKPGRRDPNAWNDAMRGRGSVVAVAGIEVVGFSDVDRDGHIDMLFVSPRYLRRGIARTLLSHIEHRAQATGTKLLSSDVSKAARPFFESMGFDLVREQRATMEGMELTNYRMTKTLTPPSAIVR
ncbi:MULTISPECIES: GNAT family N-acetyltransferase [unclassified Frondihabitans]|uniref:GNAT family N-acetyltransferase n=1 Tax=unclassified Frondihabitans TaxID=2626248 RepID=UPI000F50422D|nr:MULTISPECIES: GNAT family N-acetyltransferase [unclassified Frondihabitans]RPE78637.1 putative acetyltransferase [Frondihabitans sp. PhB153]RPF08918.1 putative acetyltransferase [Frondihabitans sp. PhB161]